jgi:hypothetical protein
VLANVLKEERERSQKRKKEVEREESSEIAEVG